MTSRFDDCFDRLLKNEGGYVDNSKDPGGETNWGITKAVARANGYAGDMRLMTKANAKKIYKEIYWDPIQGDLLEELAFHVFDAAVNSGVTQAVKWLQSAVGVMQDGIVGTDTKFAVSMNNRPMLIPIYSATRLNYLTNLPTWPTFGKGWARRIANNLLEYRGNI